MDLTSGYPYWPIKDGLLATYPRLECDIRCDVAVLGAGITGALVAQHLVDAGFDTVVIEEREAGWGSTAASTALLQYEIDVPLVDLVRMRGREQATRAYLVCRDAVHSLEQLAMMAGTDVGFERKKSLYLAAKRDDARALREEASLRQSIGIDVDYLDEREIVSRFPFQREAALLSRDAAEVDAYAFTHGLLRYGVSRGLRVFDRTIAQSIGQAKSDFALMTEGQHRVSARHLVFATGYSAAVFLDLPIAKLMSTYVIATEPLGAMEMWGEDECLIWEHARPYLYLRTTSDRRVIVGGEDEPFRNPRLRDRLLSRKAHTLLMRAHALLPKLKLEGAFAWTGTFGETRDGLAYIGEHPKYPHAFFALCYGGNGITFGVLAAEIIADTLKGRRHPHADLFRFDR